MIAGAFLFALASLGVPIAIALWNRKRHRREAFGGFYLLKKVAEVRKRRIQLLEVLKLLNRLALFTFIVLVFAEPIEIKEIFQEAGEGFVVVLDVSRVMQGQTEEGRPLVDLQYEKLQEVLSKVPSSARGSILFMADRCESEMMGSGQTTATASEWREVLKKQNIPYRNASLDVSSLERCETSVRSLFGDKDIFSVLISPLPASLGEDQVNKSSFQIEQLPTPQHSSLEVLSFRQETYPSGVSLSFAESEGEREMYLIQPPNEILPLGDLRPRADLPVSAESWVWMKPTNASDPWEANQVLALEKERSFQVVVWTKKETLGYQSLLAALRSHPQIRVVRQLGDRPVGENVIIYGPYSQGLENFERAWFFTSINGASPFEFRDQKTWAASAQARDLRRSFEIDTATADIFIRRYNLFQLDQFSVLETFKDGAPSLLRFEQNAQKIWVSPFDLEDLTTDLTLEPDFIPYLYQHLESWLGEGDGLGEVELDFEPLWLMPGRQSPRPEVVSELAWPGIYQSDAGTRVVEPLSAPLEFLSKKQSLESQASLVLREESLRDFFMKCLIFSLFIELFLCLFSSGLGRRLSLFILLVLPGVAFAQGPSSLEEGIRNRLSRFFAVDEGTTNRQQIEIGFYPGMQAQRKESLMQFVDSARSKSNLDFADPQAVKLSELWRYSCVIVSMTGTYPNWTAADHEKIRAYLERGGLLIFDDPTAVANSSFFKWANLQMGKILPGRDFKTVEKESVLFRTYYLLEEVSGRRLTSPHLKGVRLDDRWVAVFSTNDLLGASYRLKSGDFGFSVSPYGSVQRTLAERLFLNLSMYSVAVDYKDDAIHLPHILKRRVR